MNSMLVIFCIVSAFVVAANELEKKSEDKNFCDRLLRILVNEEDKLLADYLIQDELQDEYEARNENNDMCAHFVNSLMQHIDKMSETVHKLSKKDEELATINESMEDLRKKRYRGVAGRPSKSTFKSNQNNKNKINPFSLY